MHRAEGGECFIDLINTEWFAFAGALAITIATRTQAITGSVGPVTFIATVSLMFAVTVWPVAARAFSGLCKSADRQRQG